MFSGEREGVDVTKQLQPVLKFYVILFQILL